MDDPPTALAAIFVQCLLTSVQFEAQFDWDDDSDESRKRIERRAKRWFELALKSGEKAAERQVQQRGGYQD